MKTKNLFLSFILLFTVLSVNSQTINKQKQEALNTYIEYMNFTTTQVNKSIYCIFDYYKKAEFFKTNTDNNVKGFYAKPICAGQDAQITYDKVVLQSKKLNASDVENLNLLLKKNYDIYVQINKNLRELEIYHRLKDYQSDNFKRYDELYVILEDLIKQFKTTKQNLYSELFVVYRKIQPYNHSNKYHVAEEYMLEFLKTELKLYENWTLNFADNNFTNSFPRQQIIENINQTDLIYWEYDKKFNFKHPVSHYFNGFFVEILSVLHAIKRNNIDGYNSKTCVSDKYTNEAYKDFINQKNSIAWEFNSYVYACNTKNNFFLEYPKQVYEFTINKKSVNYQEEQIVFVPSNSIYSNLELIPQTEPISKNTAMALNNYIEYINKVISLSMDRPTFFRSFNTSVNSKVNKDYSKFDNNTIRYMKLTSDYKLARSYYEKAINNSRFIPENYRESVNTQTTALMEITIERQQLTQIINEYLQIRSFENDTFASAYKYIERFGELWNEFDIRKQILYNDLEQIYNSFPKIDKKNSWLVSGNILDSICKKNNVLLFNVKNYFLLNEKITETDSKLRPLIRQTLLDEYENMAGIEKLGRYHGHCPYSYYEDIAEESGDFAGEHKKLKIKSKDTLKISEYLNYYVKHYNDIIRDYNKFVWLAKGDYEEGRYIEPKIYLLQNVLQPDIFVFQSPEYIDPKDSVFTSLEGYATNNLILLLDVSSSMDAKHKLPLLKTSFIKLLKIMRIEDQVSIITFSDNAQIILPTTSCAEKTKITKVITDLKIGGATLIYPGLLAAYNIANENFIPNGNNRIILATDGEFPINSKMNKLVGKNSKKDISLSIFHFTKSEKESPKLSKLTIKGKGNYEIITPENMNLKLIKEVKKIEN